MKNFYGNDVLFSVFSKSADGEYIMVKNATKAGTWWKREKDLTRENLYSTPAAAKNAWLRRMEIYTFRELYAADLVYLCAITYFPDGTRTEAEPAEAVLNYSL